MDYAPGWTADKPHLLASGTKSLCSGINGGDNGTVPGYERSVLMTKATAEAGEKFSYGPIPFQCFGDLMRRKPEAK